MSCQRHAGTVGGGNSAGGQLRAPRLVSCTEAAAEAQAGYGHIATAPVGSRRDSGGLRLILAQPTIPCQSGSSEGVCGKEGENEAAVVSECMYPWVG